MVFHIWLFSFAFETKRSIDGNGTKERTYVNISSRLFLDFDSSTIDKATARNFEKLNKREPNTDTRGQDLRAIHATDPRGSPTWWTKLSAAQAPTILPSATFDELCYRLFVSSLFPCTARSTIDDVIRRLLAFYNFFFFFILLSAVFDEIYWIYRALCEYSRAKWNHTRGIHKRKNDDQKELAVGISRAISLLSFNFAQ